MNAKALLPESNSITHYPLDFEPEYGWNFS